MRNDVEVAGDIELKNKSGFRVAVSRVGARITSIVDSRGVQLFTMPLSGDPRDEAAADFTEGACSGWDECIPSISPLYGVGADTQAVRVSDHGDFWFRPWQTQSQSRSSVEMSVRGRRGEVRIDKHLTLSEDSDEMAVTLSVTNTGSAPYLFLYSAHPMFAWRSSARLDIPGVSETVAAFGFGTADADSGSWPEGFSRDPQERKLDTFETQGESDCYKYFARWNGEATLSQRDCPSRLVIRGDVAATPWLGVCVNRRQWPDAERAMSWIALEPATAPTDSLDEALSRGSARVLDVGESVSWTYSLTSISS